MPDEQDTIENKAQLFTHRGGSVAKGGAAGAGGFAVSQQEQAQLYGDPHTTFSHQDRSGVQGQTHKRIAFEAARNLIMVGKPAKVKRK